MTAVSISKFHLTQSGLELERRAQAGTFFDVVGRKSAVAGYENRSFEAWVYPVKILDDFKLSFRLQGYPLDIQSTETLTNINVRPEATILTYTHAAFTIRQIIFTPLEESGIVMLLDVRSVLPLTITASFRPRLKLMWPAGLMTGNLGWDDKLRAYYITEETNRFVGIVGSPLARDVSMMPYQEEPRDVPAQFQMDVPPEMLKSHFLPIVIAGGVEGLEKAKETYERLLGNVEALYEKNVAYYMQLQNETVQIETPDERLDTAFKWAKVGVDKGFATNPFLGTGMLAGFRTSGESERPGFAWFFGRDALWTTFALNSYCDFHTTRAALEFLKKFQREDGKIPHEISQSASLIPWFTDYPYAWASADATPLYVIAHADYWRASGDADFLKANWDSILKAYRFTAITDTDGNGLVENTKFGHGWVEGGALYPPHEEIYMQGLWIEASRSIAELARVMNDQKLADEAQMNALRTSAALEKTYWLETRGFYAFATSQPQAEPPVADPGPNRDARQARMNELSKGRLIDEDTVMPSVPLWFRTLADERAQVEIDHLGSGHLATDWGARIISETSSLYDPLSYHNGSVWPLFTGWVAVGAYRYGRAHVGYQALTANARLTFTSALGYVTELLSGDFNTPFGRSSHHQIWSGAMVVTPMLRGLLGIEVMEAGFVLRFAPQLPINWNSVAVRGVHAGKSQFDLTLTRTEHHITINVARHELEKEPSGARRRLTHLELAPAFPLDARIRKVTINGRNAKFDLKQMGDRQFAEIVVYEVLPANEIVFTYDEGTDVYIEQENLQPGASNQGLRILRSRADADALHLTLEGTGGHSYILKTLSPRRLVETSGITIKATGTRDPQQFTVTFDGPSGTYVRREIVIPLQPPDKKTRP
ncbi:MAG TPA: GH116 family glycosyl hydrolase [Pyrinomonadaceae bacterium]|nr:GH116 family glycosyl hydrolase [Pyrinomonadaceae bacterium]